MILAARERYAEAEVELAGAYAGLEGSLPAAHPRTKHALSGLVHLYTAWGKPEEAERYGALLSLLSSSGTPPSDE